MSFSLSMIRYSFAPKSFVGFCLGRHLFSTCSSSQLAENIMIHLQKNEFKNVEKSLDSMKTNLDGLCITQFLKTCYATEKPQLALRFFIWTGLRPNYRHSSYMYTKACDLLQFHNNPLIIARVIDEYRAEHFVVTVKMFKVVLNLCKAAKDANLGLWVLRKMKEFNCRPDTVSYNVVIRLLAEKGGVLVDEAMGLMREMGMVDLYPDIVTYVSVIKGFCDAGRLDDACDLIMNMKRHGCVPNAIIYSTLLDGICRHGTLDKAMELLSGLENDNQVCKPNAVTYTTMINGFAEKGRMEEVLTLLDRMVVSGVKPNKVAILAILDGLCKKGLLEEAYNVIDKMSVSGFSNVDLYSMLVVSLLRSGKRVEAETKFKMMVACGMIPNGMASSSMIEMLISEGRVLDGFGLFDELTKSESFTATESDIYSVLLDELLKLNHSVEATKVIRFMVERRIRIKSHLAGNVVDIVKLSRDVDLVSHVSKK